MKLVAFNDTLNMGDMLSKPIMDKVFNTNHEVVWSVPDEPHVIGIGSIANHATTKSMVFGAGIATISDCVCQDSNLVALRGPITALKAGVDGIPLSDPAILLSHYWPEYNNTPKKYLTGIIPHYVDKQLCEERYPMLHKIDIQNQDPFKVVEQICECEMIYSSSLHALIVAYSYGIPFKYIKISNNVGGDGTKFEDFYLSVKNNTLTELQQSLLKAVR